MAIYREEIFGPVLCCMQLETLDDGPRADQCLEVATAPRSSPAPAARRASTSTRWLSARWASISRFPCPCHFFSFTGWRGSFRGDLHPYGKQAVRFYTETKTVTARWTYSDGAGPQPNMSINLS
jgi:malonate-semialdehyde dehydrogenase (acetylating)/methylmalonate-semialdehyde dehydrogenase